jgi:hypothetical protein
MKSLFLCGALLATALAASGAQAAPIDFTWAPGAVGLTDGTTGVGHPGPAGMVTADDINISNFASAAIDAAGNFVETGALSVSQFLLANSGVIATGLNAPTNGYGLYYTFTASGNQGGPIPGVGGVTSGPITSLAFTLWANPLGEATFQVTNGKVTVGNNAGAFALASGTGNGTVTLAHTAGGFLPGADAVTSLVPCTAAGGVCTGDETAFYVVPSATSLIFQEAAFTNTTSVASVVPGTASGDCATAFGTTTACDFLNINGGGGDVTLSTAVSTPPIPEPATLAVLGVGLLGLAASRRRKRG